MNIYSDEVKFCFKYLYDHGVVAENYDELMSLVKDLDLQFDLVRIQHNKFDVLAKRLKELWPPGSKDGLYEWRGTDKEISRRLQIMWEDRFPKKELDIEKCVEVAKRYLERFADDTKYMQILKYFILKQKSVIQTSTGRIKYTSESKFADMLEGKDDEDAVQNEWDALIQSGNLGEGEIV